MKNIFIFLIFSLSVCFAGQKTDSIHVIKNIKVDKTVIADTVKSTSIIDNSGTTGYFPYYSATKRHTIGPIYTDGSDIAIGKSGILPWSSTYNTIDIGYSSSIIGRASVATGTAPLVIANNCYFPTDYTTMTPVATGTAHFYMMRQGVHSWFTDNVTAGVTYTPTQLMNLSSTGLLSTIGGISTTGDLIATDSVKGANLVATTAVTSPTITASTKLVSARDSTSDLIATDSVKGATGVFSSGVTLASGSLLTTYLDTVFYDSLYDSITYKVRTQCRAVQIGKIVYLIHSDFLISTISSGLGIVKGIPSKFIPATNTNISTKIVNNTVAEPGQLIYNGTNFVVQTINGQHTSGIAGLYKMNSLTYVIE